MSIVRQDTFARANQTGWGTASDSNIWTIQSGDAQSIASNEGAIGPSSASTFATLGAALAGADAEGLVRFQVAGTTADTAGVILRWTDSSNHWLCRYNGAAGAIVAMVKVAGTYTTLSPSYTFSPGASTFYWLRFRCQGSTISFRVWQDGTTEPTSWTEQYTGQTSQGVAGKAGLYGYASSTNDDLFDHFSVDDLASSTTPVTVSDSASGSESESFAIVTIAQSDTATGTDAASLPGLTTAVPVSDSATGADVYTETGIVETDSAAGSEPPITVGTITPAISDTASGTDAAGFAQAGTGIGNLAVTTKNQTWTGGPPGSPGVETDVTYTDATGSGWALGLIPTYGGMPVVSWYEVDNGNVGIDQTSTATSFPDGHLHYLTASPSGNYAGSEDLPYALTELAPAGSGFRRYYKGVFGPDSNGFNWQATVCVYPGDPGIAAFRFDLINPSGSSIALQSFDPFSLAMIGGLQQGDSTWAYTNGGYGTLAGGNVTPLPVASVNGNPVNFDPDYVYIAPASGSGVTIGQLTAKWKPISSFSPALNTPHLTVLANTARLKIALNADITGSAFPASTTSTVYFLNVLRRNLNATDAFAISADYIAPGTPSVATGSFTSFSYDEAAFVFAASGNLLNATLDLSPSHVTVRYKPRYKITGWTSTAAPNVTWGGGTLSAGSDYRYLIDTTNNILYLQMYFDVVSSGASVGQKNNAALNVSPSNVTPSVSDSATGSESAALATITPAVSESAAGVEATTLATVTPAVPDSALGSESLASLGLTLPSDSAAGSESVGLTAATPSVSDSATGDDSQLSLGTIAPSVSDTALGDDSGISVSSTIPLSASDSGVGAETAALGTIAPSVGDTAAGAEQLTSLSVTTTIGDSGTGAETVALAETIAASDTAAGSETAALGQVAISAGDGGAGAEQLTFGTVSVTPPSDSASGVEQVSPATALTAPDTAAGAEQVALGAITPLVSDGAVGSEQEALGTVSVAPPADGAIGSETPSVNVALVQPVVPDSASGSESATLGVIGVSSSDSAQGAESATLGAIAPSVPDSGLGSDAQVALGTVSTTSSDSALGAETLAPPSVSAPQSDTAAGAAEQITLGTVAPSVSDTALGTDVVGLGSSAPTISDTALGTESVSQGATVAPSVSDSALGSGAEALGATVALPVSDSSGGSEALGFSSSTITAGVSDSATGGESGPTLAPITPSAADSALGVEGPLTFGAVTPTLPTDSASGTESPPALLIEPTLPDSAAGSETLSTASATLAPSDSALGTETLGGAQVTLAPSDSAAGSESTPQIAATLPLSPDAAVGSESGPMLLVEPALSESATGAEALAETTTFGVAESAVGAETVTQGTATPGISDSAAGAEGIALFEAGPPLADSATGAETVASVSLTLQPIGLTDQAAGAEAVTLQASLAAQGVAVTLYSRDATTRMTTPSASAPLTTRDATATLTGI